MRNFRNFTVWQKATDFAVEIYHLTKNFPATEKFGLASQLQRAAVSISSNIAEGASRTSDTEFSRFLEIALGSAFEVESQLIVATRLNYIGDETFEKISDRLTSIQKQLNAFISTLKPNRQ